MRRSEAPDQCANAPDSEHDWLETTMLQDAGERFVCKWCSLEAWEPIGDAKFQFTLTGFNPAQADQLRASYGDAAVDEALARAGLPTKAAP